MIPSVRELLLILLVGALIAAWQRRSRWMPKLRDSLSPGAPKQRSTATETEIATLQKCDVCGVYQMPGPQPACERRDCPHLVKRT